ncbi:hypothetical protein [Actinoplanes philippinensis]|uniref:hypothetical protein n=1 Tax=Actinoplanes philippinensis TaxID=35752 RepID=UPI0033FDAE52
MRNRFDRVGDSPLLDRPDLRRALLTGEIPPWTAPGRTLFTIERRRTWLRPPAIEGAVHRALRVVELLEPAGDDLDQADG